MAFLDKLAFYTEWLSRLVSNGAGFLIYFLMTLVIVLLLIRFIVEQFKLSPFGRVAFYATRPTDTWFRQAKSSQIYYAMKRALPFDPIWLLLLLGFAFFFYLLYMLAIDVALFLSALSSTFAYFANGRVGAGLQATLGTVLLFFLYFAMALMTILVINSFFGLFQRPARWAGNYIYPMISSFDRTGTLAPLIFILAFWLLGALASAVRIAFF
jgi:hypothetical protein